MTSKDWSVWFLLLMVASVVCGFLTLGHQLTTDRGADYQHGWTAGYAAHEELVREQDAKLQAAGLCVYARLACGGKK